jgi:NAD(P)-dependent dehydrogenase (short-subunit alcohol dehydrogenase family)
MKRAIVTGGAGLIGTGICERLVADGWEVASFDLNGCIAEATDIRCDIADEEEVQAAFARLGWTRVDLLVNNGGQTPTSAWHSGRRRRWTGVRRSTAI